MAMRGTPIHCLISDCGEELRLSHVTTARITTSHKFSCPAHGWLGYFVPESEQDPGIPEGASDGVHSRAVPNSVFSRAELEELLRLAKLGAGIEVSDVVTKLDWRLSAALDSESVSEPPARTNPKGSS